MDNCHAIYTESPFAISQEDVDALNLSKAFCALRRCLAGQAEYVLSCCSLVRVRELIAPAYRTLAAPVPLQLACYPIQPNQPLTYPTSASICKYTG